VRQTFNEIREVGAQRKSPHCKAGLVGRVLIMRLLVMKKILFLEEERGDKAYLEHVRDSLWKEAEEGEVALSDKGHGRGACRQQLREQCVHMRASKDSKHFCQALRCT